MAMTNGSGAQIVGTRTMGNVRAEGMPVTSPAWLVGRIRSLFSARRALRAQVRAVGEQSRLLNVRIGETTREHWPVAREVQRLGNAATDAMKNKERTLRELLERDRADDLRLKAERDRLSQLAGAASHQAVELLRCLPDAGAVHNEVDR